VSQLVAERGGYDLMPEMEYRPVSKYLPPRPGKTKGGAAGAPIRLDPVSDGGNKFLRWVDRMLSR